ncbi:MAG: NAD(P)-dependent oxidoreductase [Aggregatilineales bacterium]
MAHSLLFLTDRGEWHQARARRDAPSELTVTIKRGPSAAELATLLPTAEFIISERAEPVTAAMIAQSPLLKLIVRLGSLPVGIDLDSARAVHIRVSMQPVIGSIYVAEHVLMLTLAVIKRLARSLWLANVADHGQSAHRTDEDTFAFNWLKLSDIGGLYGKRIAILGMGEIGVEFARRVAPFRPAEIVYFKRTPYPKTIEHDLGISYAPLLECARRAEVLISLLPYAPDTDFALNADFFAQVPRGSFLVHAGSGSVIDESALIDALKSGRLAGAALDTYEYEPLQPDHPLIALARDPYSNLLLTPHTAAASLPDSRADDYGEIIRFLRGEPLLYAID